jgi:hypothetical protein
LNQEEPVKTAYPAILAFCISLIGCDAKDVGKSVGESVSDFAEGVGEGADEKLMVKVDPGDKFKERGFKITTAKRKSITGATGKSVELYVISTNKAMVELIMIVYDDKSQEIGRSKVKATFEDNDAKYIDFDFDKRVDMNLAGTYAVDVLRDITVDDLAEPK